MKKGKVVISFAVTVVTLFTITGVSKAAIEARPGVNSLTNKTANYFFENIRKMEEAGGSLGLNAQIDGTTFLDSSNNGVDVHMAKNTEWGTMAMLAASSFGEAPTGTSSATTTGNESGVYQAADGTLEYVAGMWNTTNSHNSQIYNAAERYWDKYTEIKNKPGDATLETRNWKGASYANFVTSGYPVFVRSYSALFGYNSNNGNYSNIGSRATVVCGTGL